MIDLDDDVYLTTAVMRQLQGDKVSLTMPVAVLVPNTFIYDDWEDTVIADVPLECDTSPYASLEITPILPKLYELEEDDDPFGEKTERFTRPLSQRVIARPNLTNDSRLQRSVIMVPVTFIKSRK